MVVGLLLGLAVGVAVGRPLGEAVGLDEGMRVGVTVGLPLGEARASSRRGSKDGWLPLSQDAHWCKQRANRRCAGRERRSRWTASKMQAGKPSPMLRFGAAGAGFSLLAAGN